MFLCTASTYSAIVTALFLFSSALAQQRYRDWGVAYKAAQELVSSWAAQELTKITVEMVPHHDTFRLSLPMVSQQHVENIKHRTDCPYRPSWCSWRQRCTRMGHTADTSWLMELVTCRSSACSYGAGNSRQRLRNHARSYNWAARKECLRLSTLPRLGLWSLA